MFATDALTEVKTLLMELPSVVTIAMLTTAIRATMIAYSTMVAPSSSRTNFLMVPTNLLIGFAPPVVEN